MLVRRLFIVVFCATLVAMVPFLWGRQALQALGDWLSYDSRCSDEPEVAALLMGGVNSRPKAAASWLVKHPQARLVLAQPLAEEVTLVGLVPPEAVLTQKLLNLYGIRSDRLTILPPPEVANTFEEVARHLEYAKSLTPRPRALYILTGWSHSRRAAWTAQREAEDVGMPVCIVPLQTSLDTPLAWWTTDRGVLNVFSEYAKSLRYGIKYGLLRSKAH